MGGIQTLYRESERQMEKRAWKLLYNLGFRDLPNGLVYLVKGGYGRIVGAIGDST